MQALFGRNSECAGAGDRAGDARATASASPRGGPDRAQVHGAGDRALGRLPRERRRAVADSRRDELPDIQVTLPHGPARASCPTRASRRRSRGRGRVPGTPGLEHRIGGLEKQDVTGNVSYEPDNHEHMVASARRRSPASPRRSRRRRINGPADGRPAGRRLGRHLRRDHRGGARKRGGGQVGRPHPPAPPEPACRPTSARSCASTGGCSCPEINSGQLVRVLRAEYLVDAVGFNKRAGHAACQAGHRRRDQPAGEAKLMSTESGRRDRRRATRRRTSSPTRTCAGARAAATTRS